MTDFEALKGKRRTQKSFSKVTQSETRLRKRALFYMTFELLYYTINHGGIGQLSKLPGNRPVTDCHREM
jgi:hypothetical protein